ncbi:hypothetical protein [Halomonas sp. Mc5H-6]|uniref:tetratricopeptide repeat protein n=1 Tax=Halomonas sp. Mc5H-6 TaxID=2954500 RepID=UPI002097A2E6|nr:hypothetical protein [Halomonas sp. Mc5H-6]MCO7247124.1 hypothetical protein [Halomonas sp. Mc5H-6]
MRRNIKKNHNKKVFKAVFNAKSSGRAKYNFFNDLTFREIKEGFHVAAKSYFFNDAVLLTKLGGMESYLKYKTPYADVEKNIAWCLSLILHHKDDIQFAIECDQKVHDLIVRGEYEELSNILDSVDLRCGVSLWSIMLRATIDPNRQLVSQFSQAGKFKEPIDPIFNYILTHIGHYSEHDIFFAALKNHSIEIERSAPEPIKDYLLYVLFGLEAGRSYDFGKIFEVIKDTSILDIFIFMVDYLLFHTNNKEDLESLSYPAKYIIRDLRDNFEYYPIYSLCQFIGLEADWCVSSDDLNVIDLYTRGEYEEVCAKIMSLGTSDISFPIFEIAAKSNARCNTLELEGMNDLIKHMSNVFLKNSEYEYSLQFLACEAYSKRFSYWYAQLWNFTRKEALFSSIEVRSHYEKVGLLMSPHCGPKRLKAISDYIKKSYISYLRELNKNSPSLHLHMMLDGKNRSEELLDLSISKDRKTKYFGISLMQEKNYKEAAAVFSKLLSSKDSVLSVESPRLLIESLVMGGDYEEAIENFVSISLSNINVFSTFDTDFILNSTKQYAEESSSISIPIAYSLHSRFKDSLYDPNLQLAFERFTLRNNAIFPEDFFGREEELGQRELKYFLKWICVPHVMKLYYHFDNIRHTEESRLRVCNYLMESGDNDEFLKTEAKEINRSHIMRRAVKKVENSRVYVDTSTLVGRDSQKYRTLFEKYIELSRNDDSSAPNEQQLSGLVDSLGDLYAAGSPEYWKSFSILHLPNVNPSAKNSTFLNLAKMVRTEFAYGDRGLNNHLSTRIRHGVLPSALRKPLVDENLYIAESAIIEDWKDSKKADGNRGFNDDELDIIFKILKEFSSQFETVVSGLNDDRLQIYILEEELARSRVSKEENHAMFDYSVSLLESYALQKELPISPSYNDFVKVAIQWLWDRTDYNLRQVQFYIESEFSAKLHKLLDSLKAEIAQKCSSSSPISDFSNSVDRAKGSLSSQLELVYSWFAHTDVDESEDYDIETAINIAKRTLNVEVELKQEVTCKFSERNLSYMVDVFFILFENAISKSNIDKNRLRISLIIRMVDGFLVISSKNNCNYTGGIAKRNQALGFYRDAYGKEDVIKDVLQKEGGTGFFKLWKILEKDLDVKHEFDIFFDSDGFFNVSLKLFENNSLRVVL